MSTTSRARSAPIKIPPMPIPAAAPPVIPDLLAACLEVGFELDPFDGDDWERVVDEVVVAPLLTVELKATGVGADPLLTVELEATGVGVDPLLSVGLGVTEVGVDPLLSVKLGVAGVRVGFSGRRFS